MIVPAMVILKHADGGLAEVFIPPKRAAETGATRKTVHKANITAGMFIPFVVVSIFNFILLITIFMLLQISKMVNVHVEPLVQHTMKS